MKACRLARMQTWAGVGLVGVGSMLLTFLACLCVACVLVPLAAMPCMPCFGLTEKHARLQPATKPYLKDALGSQL